MPVKNTHIIQPVAQPGIWFGRGQSLTS